MIRAPSRYARIIRVFVPFAAFCGLGYLFLITFAPRHFGPEAKHTLAQGKVHTVSEPPVLSSEHHREVHLPDSAAVILDQNAPPLHLSQEDQTGELEKREPPDVNGIENWGEVDLSPLSFSDDHREESRLSPQPPQQLQLHENEKKEELQTQEPIYEVIKANGVLVMLINENQLQEARETIRQMEDRFNRGRNYPWIVFTGVPLRDQSKDLLSPLTKGTMTFAPIDKDQWRLPKWVEMSKVIQYDFEMMLKKAVNRTTMPIRYQWRFMSGFLAKHELLDPFDFFWRVDPGVNIFCDIQEDPMLAMTKSGQKFAWSSTTTVYGAGVPSALAIIQNFKKEHPQSIPTSNDEPFIIRESGDEFTTCSYAVENSISRTDFFRSQAYQTLFDSIDKAGLFFYEKWSDATVMTIALALLATRADTLYLKQLGWSLNKLSYCPRMPEYNQHCHCDPSALASPIHVSCTPFWMGITKSPRRVERLQCRADGKCKLFIGGDPLSANAGQGLKSGVSNIGFAIDGTDNAGFDDDEEDDEEVMPSIKPTPRPEIVLEGIEVV